MVKMKAKDRKKLCGILEAAEEYEIKAYSHKIEILQNDKILENAPENLIVVAKNLPKGRGYILKYACGVTQIKDVYEL